MDLALVCFPGGLAVSRSRRDDRSSVSLENTSPIMHNSDHTLLGKDLKAFVFLRKSVSYHFCP